MNSRYAVLLVPILLVSVGVGFLALDAGLLASDEYDRATVTVEDENGTTLATVEVRVADTFQKRYIGLSNTSSLADGEGMLFVHDREGNHTYVMREMAFPIDIVFVAGDGTITTIHHAELPPPNASGDDLTDYPGFGQYVLEVPYGYTNRTGIDEGDRIVIDGLDD